jgi:hypothetical protein
MTTTGKVQRRVLRLREAARVRVIECGIDFIDPTP